ncbi:tol-pal system-associated acyl-CoA thioesterase [Vibrio sp. SM6]|uniref:Tol-pal system-associated acyl-CoA thioesterase n=1 Tax=Vibrio agarilyticus TaxID=2726741 RepID=A0A7X8TNI7_9VIBR|nr:tol-pal system-associated acyl-CoA thioesterase [Vibrio agarilyticus]
MSSVSANHIWPITVYFEDTDAGGVVYHANYLKFFERARTEMLRDIGVGQCELLSRQIGFVVRHMDIDFIQSARLDDKLTVTTKLIELKRVSMVFCQELVNDAGKPLCKAQVQVACIDNSRMKPIAIPPFIISELTKSVC